MNGKQLYEELKDALAHFGLKFHEMDKIEVGTSDDAIIFTYAHRWVAVGTKPREDIRAAGPLGEA